MLLNTSQSRVISKIKGKSKMTLDEIFARSTRGWQVIKRTSLENSTSTVANWKHLKKRAIPEALETGFYVLPSLREGMIADDWEFVT